MHYSEPQASDRPRHKVGGSHMIANIYFKIALAAALFWGFAGAEEQHSRARHKEHDEYEMQIVLYNPLTAWAPDRLEQISNEFMRIDVVILVATADRAFEDYTIQASTTYHTVYKHGWIKGRTNEVTETNKACGITFLIKKSLTNAVRQHIQP